jgi:hypothetical protein
VNLPPVNLRGRPAVRRSRRPHLPPEAGRSTRSARSEPATPCASSAVGCRPRPGASRHRHSRQARFPATPDWSQRSCCVAGSAQRMAGRHRTEGTPVPERVRQARAESPWCRTLDRSGPGPPGGRDSAAAGAAAGDAAPTCLAVRARPDHGHHPRSRLRRASPSPSTVPDRSTTWHRTCRTGYRSPIWGPQDPPLP